MFDWDCEACCDDDISPASAKVDDDEIFLSSKAFVSELNEIR